MLEIDLDQAGDVAGELRPFDFEASYRHREWFFTEWGISFVPSALRAQFRRIATTPYVEDDDAESFLVSRNVMQRSARLRTAVNPDTGDVLVVWHLLDAGSGVVRSSLLRRSVNGRYAAVEDHVLSDTRRYGAHPYPLFVEDSGHFLVVWDEADPRRPELGSQIRGRVVAAHGLPAKKAFRVLGQMKRNERPQLFLRAGVRSGSGGRIDMVVNSVSPSESEVGERRSVSRILSLNRKYVAGKGSAVVQRGAVVPGDGHVIDGHLVLSVAQRAVRIDGAVELVPMMIVLDGDNRVTGSWQLGAPGSAPPHQGLLTGDSGSDVVVATVARDPEVVSHGMTLDGSGRLSPLFSRVASTAASEGLVLGMGERAAEAGARVRGYQVVAGTDGWVYRRGISWTGDPVGRQKSLFAHHGSLRGMTGLRIGCRDGVGPACTGEAAEFLILWERELEDGESQIRAQLFSVNSPGR